MNQQTKLQAVNAVLLSLGEKQINSIENPASQSARIVLATIDQSNRIIQTEGWHWNTEPDKTVSADANTGEVPLPPNTIYFQVHDEPYILQRGLKLFDRRKGTTVLEEAKTGRWVYFLEWEELPEYAKAYIVAKAARLAYEQNVGANENRQNLYQEEQRARAICNEHEANQAEYSVLDDAFLPHLHGSAYVPTSPRNNPRD